MKTAFLFLTLAAVALAKPQFNPRKWHPAQPVPEGANILSHNVNFDAVKAFAPFEPKKAMTKLATTPRESKPMAGQADICGQEQTDGAKSASGVINGQEANPHQFPWLAHLQCKRGLGTYVCTTSIITPNTILTAGHCVYDCDTITITVGCHDWRHPEPEAQQIVADYIYHEDYNPDLLWNDMAVVNLPEPITIDNKYTMLSCMPTESDVGNLYENEVTTVTGWGKTGDDVGVSDVLMYARDIPTMTNAQCQETYGIVTVEDQDICIDATDSGICGGDSGGPLNWYDNEKQQFTQIGVTSFGHKEGCEFGHPNGYTRTTYFLDWIAANSDFVPQA